ncbi:MAG TPA: 3-phosphoshikimate 1-carboxyvinyltransferase [Dysgonomonas sp.]|nr:3-phosphoshikimate 1-carboxyvinyltransferase [Dysgonomonas sp.]
MRYKITAPRKVHSVIDLPASKSISNRALILNTLSNSPFPVENLSNSDDTQVMIDAFHSTSDDFDIGAAGTSMRFLTAYFSHTPGERTITGSKRMQERPINVLVEALNTLGGDVEYIKNNGFPPLKIRGKALEGGDIFLSGGISSQFISALLMIAPYMKKGLKIHLEGEIISAPYIKMTLKMMEEYGVKSEWEGNTIKIYPNEYKPVRFKVESDWSAASYWYSIAALSEDSLIELRGLREDSVQGDSNVAGLFLDLGVKTEYTNDGIILRKNGVTAKKIFHNFVNEPDLAQTFVVTCCLLNVPFLFTGLQSLKIKETDRIEALKAEMKKLGYIIRDSDNSVLEWNGERTDADADPVILTYEDHRMAMAFAPASIKLEHLYIEEPMVVTKSYPHFWKDLEKAGFSVEE